MCYYPVITIHSCGQLETIPTSITAYKLIDSDHSKALQKIVLRWTWSKWKGLKGVQKYELMLNSPHFGVL